MPEYTYLCNNCDKKFTIICSISSYKSNAVCEFCSSKKTERSYEDDLLTINASVKKADSELKTIGDLARRNTDRMSEDEKTALYLKHNAYKDQQDLKPLPSGMSRVKKPPKIKWPGSTGTKQKRKPKNG
jgi:putative FmdB family regulatory protein